MSVLASLKHHLGTLVHPEARAVPLDALRHRDFIVTRLALSLGTLMLAPPSLIVGTAPSWWQAAALGWLMLPFAVAAFVSHTGRLAAGEASSISIWLGLAATVTAGSGCAGALGLLALVPLEAVLASALARPARILACGAALAVGAALALAVAGHGGGPTLGGRFVVMALAAAAGYGLLLIGVAARGAARRRARDVAREARVRLLAELSDDVLLTMDGAATVIEASAGGDRIFAVTPRDLVGRGLFDRIHVADRPGFLTFVADAASGREVRSATFRLRTGRTLRSEKGDFGEPVFAWAEFKARNGAGAFEGPRAAGNAAVVALMRDATLRLKHEKAITEAEASARRNDAGRDRFLANVTHELRTPLNAIIGFSEMLCDETLIPQNSAKRREYAGIIQQSGEHLLAVVNTILDATKIEAGSFDFNPEVFAFDALIRSCTEMVGLKAEQSRIRLAADVAPGLGEIVADKRACKQIVLNLLSNALKFTPPEGSVTVAVRPDGTSLLIVVTDTGIGIGARDLPRLGDPFFQARDGYDRDRDGTGLGLSVVRGLVGLHGGSIAVESAPGHGTRVTVRLPSDCRRHAAANGGATRIETIPRYSAGTAAGGSVNASKVYKRA